jgi:cell wall-associated NlpC family hydrolase
VIRIAAGLLAAVSLCATLIAAGGMLLLQSLFGTSTPSGAALADIPAAYLALYRQAATVCPGLDWSILAAIGKIETDHGRSPLPGVHSGTNSAGAGGPMQFLAPTFAGVTARHPLPPGGQTPPSLYDPHDAIYAAAFYLCDNGAARDLRAAIFAYNHANWYVDEVLAQAHKYSQQTLNASAACDTFQQTVQQRAVGFNESRGMVAVQFACAQLGKPYVWGGNGNPGFDCSGLTKAAYAAAGISLPRVAQDQYTAGPLLPAGTPLQPGDLVFFGTSTTAVTHVGIALSPFDMIDAPDVNEVVRIDRISLSPVGATRPEAGATR